MSVTPQYLTTASGRPARVALIHDWFAAYYGSERVVEQILRLFPEADLFTLVDVLPDDQRGFLGGRRPSTSFIQRLPFARKRFRAYLGLMPLAIEQFDLSGYDLVISSSHAFAKGVLTGPHQLHVSYVHAPMRYAWEYQHQYLRESGIDRGVRGMLGRWLLHRLRIWDLRTANGVDCFLANSDFIRRRIWKIYRRQADVLHPPVATDALTSDMPRGEHYLAVSRFVPYKRTELIIEAFAAMPERRIVVIGDGPGLRGLKVPANVELLGFQSTEVVHRHLQTARALVFAAEEDFGITPVEAQAAGAPVIAYGRGGVAETVRDLGHERPTGVLFHEQSVEAIMAAVERFERDGAQITAAGCAANAERFSMAHFHQGLRSHIDAAWSAHLAGSRPD